MDFLEEVTIHHMFFNVRNVPEITVEFFNEENGVQKYSLKYSSVLMTEEQIKSSRANDFLRRNIEISELSR